MLIEDYSAFAHPDFDPNDYANALLAGEPYPPPGASLPASAVSKGNVGGNKGPPSSRGATFGSGGDAEDISVAVSKLTFNIMKWRNS